jgi:hypothetical protein
VRPASFLMRFIRTHRLLSSAGTLTITGVLVLASATARASAQGHHRPPDAVPSIPHRQAAAVAAPAPLPNVLPGAEAVPALTLEIAVHRGAAGAGAEVIQRVTRGANRIHLAAEQAREWLFERNPVDGRRLAAYLVDHPSRTVVVYGESDVRMLLGLRGWADILSLGFAPERLAGYQRSGEQFTMGSVRFTRYVPRRPGEADLWWSEHQLVAREFASPEPGGETRVRITSARNGVDAAVLELPPLRFPKYTIVDVADWLEGQ